ncbi:MULTISPECIES: hypothetical protein [unclassified Ochrobactrum]|uniref:hypothetical protein n=1 Tax=unclassified Ochrobactrum TaxID=239106 RepID=UPI000DEF64AC|nr:MULTISPECIES: hypothetical protein [unclassified Ochrobactrum]MBQ0710432.1 hypothetical protein [Ochrobactrum sp. AP1BH01-1]
MRLSLSARNMIRLAASRFPDLMALICGLLVLPWILGVPGHPDPMVRLGWTIGLVSLVFYLVLYQITKSIASNGSLKNRVTVQRYLRRVLAASSGIVTVMMVISAMLVFRS